MKIRGGVSRLSHIWTIPTHDASDSKAVNHPLVFLGLFLMCNVVPLYAQSSAGPAGFRAPRFRADFAGRKEVMATPQQASASTVPGFQVTPYLFWSGIKGSVGSASAIVDVDAGITDIFDDLNFGFAMTFEAKLRGRWRFMADFNYTNISDDNVPAVVPIDSIQSTSKTLIFDPEIGYEIWANDDASLDVVGGVRYWNIDNEIEFRIGAQRPTVSSRPDWLDLVGGLRGKVTLSPRLYLTGKADLGGLGSDSTYQLFGGAGITLTPRLAAVVGYRYLNVNYKDDNTVFDVGLHGFVTGLGIRF